MTFSKLLTSTTYLQYESDNVIISETDVIIARLWPHHVRLHVPDHHFSEPLWVPEALFSRILFDPIYVSKPTEIWQAGFCILSYLKPPIWHVHSKIIGRGRLLPELEPQPFELPLKLKNFVRPHVSNFLSKYWCYCIDKHINNMIGETGMEENFDVSLSSSFIRKKRQQERECGFYIQSRRCNVLRLKCEWMCLESGHTARTHCCNFSIMRTAVIETSPSHMNMESRSHIWMFGQPLRTAKSSPTSTRSRQTRTSTYCQQVTILHTSARTSRMASDYAFVWSSASRQPWNFVWRNCPRFSPRVAILKVLLLSSLIVFAKNRGKPSWTPTGKEHQSQTTNKQELHLCADGVLSCPRCSLF